MGNITATDEDVINAAKQAGCHEFIASLSEGYETAAGNAGNKLSGGQKQRIAIARAILKDAPIVILMKRAPLWTRKMKIGSKSIEALTEKKTLIMIAHRLHTVIHCDCIFVVDDGHIIACGTHDELLKNCMVYQDPLGKKSGGRGERMRPVTSRIFTALRFKRKTSQAKRFLWLFDGIFAAMPFCAVFYLFYHFGTTKLERLFPDTFGCGNCCCNFPRWSDRTLDYEVLHL